MNPSTLSLQKLPLPNPEHSVNPVRLAGETRLRLEPMRRELFVHRIKNSRSGALYSLLLSADYADSRRLFLFSICGNLRNLRIMSLCATQKIHASKV